ncbi:MAG TPA: hypothetical protein VGS27_29205 [Candidatus Sulfotelmatobacter sp.]|nr:hypothetical protein [Candidatus Sulfotelmatobacter sp.]
MNGNPAEQFFQELLPYLEKLDAQIGALVHMLKDKGVTTPDEFARYVEKADLASDVRDRGLRVRMERLFALTEGRNKS